MTIALGMLATDGLVLASDTQETIGEFKSYSRKINSSATTLHMGPVKLRAAIGITGAGPSVHIDAVSDGITKIFHDGPYRDMDALEAKIRSCVADFYREHSQPLYPNKEFNLIIGAQLEGKKRLWSTDTTVMKEEHNLVTVGTGGQYARMALKNRYFPRLDVKMTAIVCILAIAEAKEYDAYCGKNTDVVCVRDNVDHIIPWYTIEAVEEALGKYSGIDYSAFAYALGHFSEEEEEAHIAKMSSWMRDLRSDVKQLASQMLKDQP